MPDLKNLENVYLIITLLVPGLLIIMVRSQFHTGRTKPPAENALVLLTLSLIYYGLTLSWLGVAGAQLSNGLWGRLTWIGLVIIGPILFGLLWGIVSQSGLLRRLAHLLRLNPLHALPTGWDWAFQEFCKSGGGYLIVKLSTGTVAGKFEGRSMASSDPAERDLYLQEVWNVSDDGLWSLRPRTAGMLIPAKEILGVEFFQPRDSQ